MNHAATPEATTDTHDIEEKIFPRRFKKRKTK